MDSEELAQATQEAWQAIYGRSEGLIQWQSVDGQALSRAVLLGWLSLMEEIPDKHQEDLCLRYALLLKTAGVVIKTSRETGVYNGNWPLFATWDQTVRKLNGQ